MNAPTVSVVLINKNEAGIADTLDALEAHEHSLDAEIVVVDASSHRFDSVKAAHPTVTWIDFAPVPGVVTIAHQRNAGVRAARGDIIVYTDASCIPRPGWLDTLVGPILDGSEQVTAGGTYGVGDGSLYEKPGAEEYLEEAPTINLAFTREVFDRIGGFDERYAYGSDVDFSWRLRRAGVPIRHLPDAAVVHDWGTPKRQLKRAFQYGEARARLYATHPWNLRRGLRRDPIVFAYPLYLLLLPLTVFRRTRWIPLLILVPLMRNRDKRPFLTVADHLCYGAGALSFVWKRLWSGE